MPRLEPRSRTTDPAGGRGWVGLGSFVNAVLVVYAWATPQSAVTITDYLLASLALLSCVDLLFAWWQVGPRLLRPVTTAMLRTLPLPACPPLFGLDVNAYLMQGWVVLDGHDSYVTALEEPQLPGIVVGADWVGTTSVYPARSLLVFAAVFQAGGGLPWLGFLPFRVLYLVYLLVVARVVRCLALRVGVPVNTAPWAGVATPLLVF